MNLNNTISAFAKFGELLQNPNSELQEAIALSEMHNTWFSTNFQNVSLQHFAKNYLNQQKLEQWVEPYKMKHKSSKKIGLIVAGNVPFVGMHDILSVLISGNIALIKLSAKDQFFFKYMQKQLLSIDPDLGNAMQFIERLKDFDAVIATGSSNSSRYFDYYFKKHPHIIRKNRTSIAIIDGTESDEALIELGKDVFYYYGLGCRNVSKIFVPAHYQIQRLFELWSKFEYVLDNNKYKNNFDYNLTLLLLNQTPHLANQFFIITENLSLFSPLATLHYSFYTSKNNLQEVLLQHEDKLQCIVTESEKGIQFGSTQYPQLNDYADNIDTLNFLTSL